ncbi:MAG TPA: PhzF family phenazine biosynthesis protein [Methylomirabilota bacterium]|nr:PhzF family phenazine biosynthesis protein [Methylomirabilota bacterium]
MTRSVVIAQVDAFTRVPFCGNPAGVVLDAGGLSELEMKNVAAEMNVAETAFLTPATRPDADYRLRWFTPSGKEVKFCGHATIATVHALVEAGRLRPGRTSRIVFDTLGGLLPVSIEERDSIVAWLEPALQTVVPFEESLASTLEALGLPEEALAGWATASLTTERDLLLPISGLGDVKSLALDFSALKKIGADLKIRGFCLTTLETVDRESSTHSRFFAPHYGIPEDPITGSVHASIPVWLWHARVLRNQEPIIKFQAEQGDLIGRPGRLQIELHLSNGQPVRVRVGGSAVTVVSGTIRIG